MQAWIGTRTSADVNLGAQLIMLALLWAGFYFARAGQYRRHANVQTAVVLVNLLFIALVMGTSFWNYIIQGGTVTGTVAMLMMIHGAFGLVAELAGIYLIVRMRTNLLPPRLRVGNFKRLMRATLALWTVLVALGLAVYAVRYLAPRATAVAAAPVAQISQQGDDLVVHALEMRDALTRGSLPTARRHAEHVINLVVGRENRQYGDLDQDGFLEDPGDGVGLLVYIDAVAVEVGSDAARTLARTLGDQLRATLDRALGVLHATDLRAGAAALEEVDLLVARITPDGIEALAGLAGASSATPVASSVGTALPQRSNAVTIVLDQLAFGPANVTVEAGATVVFVNREAPKHTATADAGAFDSGDLVQGGEFAFTFAAPGVYPYFCKYHGDRGGIDMAGTISVK